LIVELGIELQDYMIIDVISLKTEFGDLIQTKVGIKWAYGFIFLYLKHV